MLIIITIRWFLSCFASRMRYTENKRKVYLPSPISFPKTPVSLVELQFHRLALNCHWHSRRESLAPDLTGSITSRFLLQIRTCLRVRPGRPSHWSAWSIVATDVDCRRALQDNEQTKFKIKQTMIFMIIK